MLGLRRHVSAVKVSKVIINALIQLVFMLFSQDTE